MQEKAIVLVSGGLDSATALAWSVRKFEAPNIIPLSFFYGQRHHVERQKANELCDAFNCILPVNIDLSQAFVTIGGSSLTSGRIDTNPSDEEVDRTPSDLPPTFVPGRNLLFISVAASIAYVEKAKHVVGGWNAVDYSGYPDCRREFLVSMQITMNNALGLDPDNGLLLHAPLLAMMKSEIIKQGLELGVPFEKTWSCYAGGDQPCGECDSCKIRAKGFADLGIADPAMGGGVHL